MKKNNTTLILTICISSLLLSSCSRDINSQTKTGPDLEKWVEEVKSRKPAKPESISPPIMKETFDYNHQLSQSIKLLDEYENKNNKSSIDENIDTLEMEGTLIVNEEIIEEEIINSNNSVENSIEEIFVEENQQMPQDINDKRNTEENSEENSEEQPLPSGVLDQEKSDQKENDQEEIKEDLMEEVEEEEVEDSEENIKEDPQYSLDLISSHIPHASIRLGPFTPPVSFSSSVNRPSSTRIKENLEAFELDSLSMVGSIGEGSLLSALIRAPDGVTYRVREGQYLGKNDGRVVNVSTTHIDIVELFFNGTEYVERSASITLSE